MKLTKIAGAFALTAAMAMSAVPAFAVATAENVENFKEASSNTSAATTKVYAETVNADLNATIPTRVAIVMPSLNAGDITGPSSEAYKIINKGTNPVYLKKIASAGTGFTLQATPATSGTANVLALKVNNYVLDGSSKDLTGTDVAEIAANNGELGLALTGKSYIGTAIGAGQLDSAIMTITYTISSTK